MKKLTKNIENTLNESIEAYTARRDCYCNCNQCICDCLGYQDLVQSNLEVVDQESWTLTAVERHDY